MNNLLTSLQNRFQPRALELEVEEELRLHIDLIFHENIKRGLSPEEARAATLKRFGNLDQVKNECVEICRRSSRLQRALKSGLILLALTGLIISFTGADFHVAHIGDTLIMIAIAARLLLYVRSLTPSRFLAGNNTSKSRFLNANH